MINYLATIEYRSVEMANIEEQYVVIKNCNNIKEATIKLLEIIEDIGEVKSYKIDTVGSVAIIDNESVEIQKIYNNINMGWTRCK